MKHDYAKQNWDDISMPKERQAEFDAAFEEIFGKPMTHYEESEWEICEALNAARKG